MAKKEYHTHQTEGVAPFSLSRDNYGALQYAPYGSIGLFQPLRKLSLRIASRVAEFSKLIVGRTFRASTARAGLSTRRSMKWSRVTVKFLVLAPSISK